MTALIPGSFDPITLGHADLIARAARLFDRVVVAILRNPQKPGWLAWDQREALVRDVIADMPGASVLQFEGLTIDCARAVGAAVIVRGVRSYQDFEYESALARMNEDLVRRDESYGAIETIFLTADPAIAHWSSSAARMLISFGGEPGVAVPDVCAARLRSFIAGK